MTPLPRSALLALWSVPVLAGRAAYGPSLRVVQGDDEPHEVSAGRAEGLTALPGPRLLPELLHALGGHGVTCLRLVLPVPGDPSGLPGPPSVNAEAVEAGECLVTVGGPPLALVPQVHRFGSVHEPGHRVVWHVLDCAAPRVPVVTAVSEAEQELREALALATTTLTGLEVDRWRPDAADRLEGLRADTPTGFIPTSTTARAVRVLELARRVGSIVALAREDQGGAVDGWQAQRREETLRRLGSVSRRALVSAVNAPRL